MRRFLLIVVVGCVASCWTSLWAEEDIKYPSPDGRFALRITQSKDDEYHPTVGFRANPPGARLVELGTLVCFWNGSGFDKVFLPENLPQPDIKFPKGKRRERETLGGGVRPLRWLKSGDLEMSNEDMMLSRDDGKSYTRVLQFTISFDAQHHASVKKIEKTKTEVDD